MSVLHNLWIHFTLRSCQKKQKLRITYVIRSFCLIWYARLDSNQRPTESELSGRQAANRCGTTVWWVLHKFAVIYEKSR